jgi:putative GTP pyrophosphokinase
MTEKTVRSKKLREATSWYDANLELHERVAKTVRRLLRNMLRAEKVDSVAVTARTKKRQSFLGKASKRKYKAPAIEIKDVVGIRVVTYFDSVVHKAGEIIKREFEIDWAHSFDKSKLLGTDRVGYRSVHYIARLRPERLTLAEYKDFDGIWFEIQVRSVLQHAWAEIEHDRRFKFPGELPTSLQRRFSVLAGTLELIDREFDAIASEIDSFTEAMPRAASGDQAKQPLTVVGLSAYLTGIFKDKIDSGMVSAGLVDPSSGKMLIGELKAFGVRTLGQLSKLIPKDFEQSLSSKPSEHTTFFGIVRLAMMLKDADRYFKKAWNKNWAELNSSFAEILRGKQIDIEALASTYDFMIGDTEPAPDEWEFGDIDEGSNDFDPNPDEGDYDPNPDEGDYDPNPDERDYDPNPDEGDYDPNPED